MCTMMLGSCEFSAASSDAKPFPRWKPHHVEPSPPPCPRCSSSNTKFCYYNNYSLSQPRYLCKSCRRYWTKGGFLRNVPVRGGSRKSRRPKTTRLPPSQRVSTNYAPTNSDTNGSDIDMAVVFANYLSSGNDVPQPSDPVVEGEGMVFPRDESSVMSGIELEWESLLGGGDGGEVVQDDVFCLSDATTSSSSSVMWQPPPPLMQLPEELDNPLPFNYDEVAQFPIIADYSWNWNSFDFPTLQAFSSSRPLDP
ncbi:hypothetical protein QN277_015497 [Acacia crassicarpa]|uniref:Dof zinc finger protein n=2 Tax=Acacia crassicarpa TaxID=499986 RepID=A0AAE1JVZ0_9FABA|nr:hypothetical protein QN277_015497 [Acacia crassicarpa]